MRRAPLESKLARSFQPLAGMTLREFSGGHHEVEFTGEIPALPRPLQTDKEHTK